MKNLPFFSDYPTVFFDTQEVSKPSSDHPLNMVDMIEDEPFKPDWAFLDQLAQKMRHVMEMDLFGFDVIIDVETGQYGIIDINAFPGFEAVENLFSILLDHMLTVLDARDKGELMNGRLMPFPENISVSPNTLNSLNTDLSLRAQHTRDVHFNGKGRPLKKLSASPIIDLNLLGSRPSHDSDKCDINSL
ncbi:inositol-tetrakisphosphate 1-kinase [Plakobranchus ocellatus]|uniref:inositol-1,3,4-trisphosphate 5/6-kinase n=1 Tax=Plakobranchus ocellatus TaxID=259542 RepID=A0AAV4CTJ8_9GAST|nr:inositol-tetrakisphosphate 1-kinase [Plakobranchus ocellatus]